jgi:hypothetical protein
VAGAWTDVEVKADSRAAGELVKEQRATCLQACAKALMSQPHVALGLVVHNSTDHKVVWQISEFAEATQTFIAQRTSSHLDSFAFPTRAMFSLSTVEVLISPTLPFLTLMLDKMALTKVAAVARFPIPDKIMVPSRPKVNDLTHSLEFEVRKQDGTFHSRLVVALPRDEGPPAAATAGENTEASRRVAQSTPGSAMQLGVGLLLRMSPKDARNIMSLRITSSLSFDLATETELLALRYGSDMADMSRFLLGDSARLAYRRVCNCQELLFRLFHLKPHVMAVSSAFAAQILDAIEHGEARFPWVASNGVINHYVEQVLQTFFAPTHQLQMPRSIWTRTRSRRISRLSSRMGTLPPDYGAWRNCDTLLPLRPDPILRGRQVLGRFQGIVNCVRWQRTAPYHTSSPAFSVTGERVIFSAHKRVCCGQPSATNTASCTAKGGVSYYPNRWWRAWKEYTSAPPMSRASGETRRAGAAWTTRRQGSTRVLTWKPSRVLTGLNESTNLILLPLVAVFGWTASSIYYSLVSDAVNWAHNGASRDTCWTDGPEIKAKRFIHDSRCRTGEGAASPMSMTRWDQ